MPSILGTLQFDDDKICCLVDGKQVDSTLGVLPVPELL